jgi:hypothetical protein
LAVAAGDSSMPLRIEYSWMFAWMNSANCTKRCQNGIRSAALLILTSVTGFTRESHESMCVQGAGFVVFGFEDGGASHGGFRRGNEGEVFARDS